MGRVCGSRDVGVPLTGDGDPAPFVEKEAPHVAGVEKSSSVRIDAGHERVPAAVVGRVRPVEYGERRLVGKRDSGDGRSAESVHIDVVAGIVRSAADVSGVRQRRVDPACDGIGSNFRHERVVAAVVVEIRPDVHGKADLGGSRPSRHIGVAVLVDRDAVAFVRTRTPDETGIVEPVAAGADLCHEGVACTAVVGQVRSDHDGDRAAGRWRDPGHVGGARPVYGDGAALVIDVRAEEAGVVEPRPGRIHLCDEGVDAAPGDERGTNDCGKRAVVRQSVSDHVRVAGGVDVDAGRLVGRRPADVAGVNESGAVRLHLDHESVRASVVGRVGTDEDREWNRARLGRLSPAGDVGIARGVDGDPVAGVRVRSPDVPRVSETASVRQNLRDEGVRVHDVVEGEVGADNLREGRLARERRSGDVGAPGCVDRDREPGIGDGTTDEAGVDEDRGVDHEWESLVVRTDVEAVGAGLPVRGRQQDKRSPDRDAPGSSLLIGVGPVVAERRHGGLDLETPVRTHADVGCAAPGEPDVRGVGPGSDLEAVLQPVGGARENEIDSGPEIFVDEPPPGRDSRLPLFSRSPEVADDRAASLLGDERRVRIRADEVEFQDPPARRPTDIVADRCARDLLRSAFLHGVDVARQPERDSVTPEVDGGLAPLHGVLDARIELPAVFDEIERCSPDWSEAGFPDRGVSRRLRLRRPVGLENSGEPEERQGSDQEKRTPEGAPQRNPPAGLFCRNARNSSTNLTPIVYSD